MPAPHHRCHAGSFICGAVVIASLAGCGSGGGGGTTTATTTTAPTAGGQVAQGKALSTSQGCSSCHTVDGSASVGPTWKGLAGSSVKLTDGKTVTADDAYLLTAIENPDKQIVSGYRPGVMSGTIPPGSVSATNARALVAYIKSLR